MFNKSQSRRTLVAGLLALSVIPVAFTASAQTATLSVTIRPGYQVTGRNNIFYFPANTATVSGGSGSYQYSWSETDDGIFRWTSGGTMNTFSPRATALNKNCESSDAYYTVTIVDSVTGQRATSNTAYYQYTYKNGTACP